MRSSQLHISQNYLYLFQIFRYILCLRSFSLLLSCGLHWGHQQDQIWQHQRVQAEEEETEGA